MEYHYQGRPDKKINFYAGYFASQGQDRKIVDYRLQRLFDLAERIRIPTGSGSRIEINKATLMNNGKRELILFWYDLNGRIIAGNAAAKMASLYDAVVRGRSNGALIIVGTRIENSDDASPLLDSEIEFVQGVLPALRDLFSAGSDAQPGRSKEHA
jgi:EpsI family protein